MDPKACLDEAELWIDRGDPEEAIWALDAYSEWRAREGFTTAELDQRHKALCSRLPQIAFLDDWDLE